MALEGKTKRLIPGSEPGTLIMVTKDELTGGDAAKKATITGIATHKTTQTANVFSLLTRHNIPTAFIRKESETSLLCQDCDMLPLELVMRRYAWGSFLKREPQYQRSEPYRFDEIKCEFFHKWAVVMSPLTPAPIQMEENEARAKYLKDGVWAEGVYTDPYLRIQGKDWFLHSAKLPVEQTNTLMQTTPVCTAEELSFIVNKLMLPCFQVLENAWKTVVTAHGPVVLCDIKIEVGRKKTDGQLVIADVIDNDSWRIWPGGDPKRQLDKQNFRDGHPLRMVSDNYALVAELTSAFLK
ncbi:MAG: phosphoribosylaminoimidazolesuccinocarboxamide synthase [SAR324 cluster bacterium]|nr:phosphoribosylaminoimidazolesuccinocarboxamide synthase [SAR324 cluster bacterium]